MWQRQQATRQDVDDLGQRSDAVEGAAFQGDETVKHTERGKAAIDEAVAAGETGAARGGIKEGDRVPKLTRAQQRHARRAKARTEANKIEEREE